MVKTPFAPWPHNALRLVRPADWGLGMTVCIAGMANVGKSIVLACDSMISTGEVSGDQVAFKLYPLAAPAVWWAMIAGDEITQVWPVIQEANNRLLAISADSLTSEAVGRAFADSYQWVRRSYAQDRVLSPFGITMEEFRSDGQRIFGDTYREVAADLMRVDLGCEFLLAGFDRDGDGHILTVGNPGVVRNYDPVGFWAIGSGAPSALSMLFFHSVRYVLPLANVLYHVCEAKIMAESAFGVGKHTTVKVLACDSPMDAKELSQDFITNVRNAWEHDGKPHLDSRALQRIENELKKPSTVAESSTPPVSQKSADR